MKRIVFICSLAAVLSGCVTTTKTIAPDPSILRVGVSPRSQPVIYKQGDQIMGIEADFAKQLGTALKREIVFVETPWNKLIDAVEQNKIDIIMSNMTVTAPRSIRINFTTPYLQSGLSALFVRGRHEPSGLIGSTILNQTRNIGYVKDTTGEFYCVQRFTRGTLNGYKDTDAAIQAMLNGKIDMFVHDAPMIWWRSSMHERKLVAFPEVLNIEPVAWGIGRHNSELMDEVNALLARWEKDGTSKKIITNWLPNL
ncbi:transporter substrate-binding domain-containing protein [Pontiellaceae bacterium B12227]|nr:transporter substrate-binding domain-containing protein [Pontiellaceae bacterium B12227]